MIRPYRQMSKPVDFLRVACARRSGEAGCLPTAIKARDSGYGDIILPFRLQTQASRYLEHGFGPPKFGNTMLPGAPSVASTASRPHRVI